MTELSGMTASEAIAASDGVRARSGAAASRRAQEHPPLGPLPAIPVEPSTPPINMTAGEIMRLRNAGVES